MNKELHIEDIRTDYRLGELNENQLESDPISQFERWFAEAIDAGVVEVNAMTLATTDADGSPDARIVLLKDIENGAFVFYTNYNSQKAREIEANHRACLVFFWPALQRQIRVRGAIEKVDEYSSEAYFHSRPIGSQLGAWASPQSDVIANRTVLEENLKRVFEKYKDQNVPKPPHWGGYKVVPSAIEFWQGRQNRLHDRILYTRDVTNNVWTIDRLAP
ncbi:pyridoxamine 5'-phosphate oxidase [Olivibacter sp. XZL3]|uniref:pyridoxamine 5'-phosphate oxidase n=1 Tax=Olivibacter sp. XZL3 TaxID=1735116 RepID=UPI0010669284|nr:pyridoxamine 5'-phosphate oxidase [Olivibacter sp. XZL3]